ncbi:MAG: penicillin-binding protein 2 [Puniceicoccales bacterium]|jgi:cell division protein FtsI/penicillin-binding protein 2|nr:penicillin-binding protein 2 [Puniceicoccales bacterium]
MNGTNHRAHSESFIVAEEKFLSRKVWATFGMQKKNARHLVVICAVALLFCVMGWRVLDLSYVRRDKYYGALKNTRSSTATIPARRGNILDRNLEVLAMDETKITIGVDPYAANADGDMSGIMTLAEILELDANDILEKFKKTRKIVDGEAKKIRWCPICEIGSDSLHSAIGTLGIRGLYGIRNRRRMYPFANVMAHITGFVNFENAPVCGVERYVDLYLRGQDGYVESEKDGGARELAQFRRKEVSAKEGSDVVLTIDANVQRIVYDEVQKLVEKFSPKSVSAIVSTAATGEILALVNYPDYDPNNYGKYPLEHMKNLAVCEIYEPGSVFKIVVTSFGLEYGLVDENSVFDCAQSTAMNRGQKVSLPHDYKPFGQLNLIEAVRKSSNRAAAQIAMLIGEEAFYNCVRAYGFGEKAGYGFDGESIGILFPVSKWDAWTITRMPMGHAIGAVPLQTHCAMSVIANDGVLMKPNLFGCIVDGDDEILRVDPVVRRRVISKQTAVRLRKILRRPEDCMLKKNVDFGGKSGTGQKIIDGHYSQERNSSSYSGFFPVDEPKFVITVIADDARVDKGVAWGSRISLPTFKGIALRMLKHFDMFR